MFANPITWLNSARSGMNSARTPRSGDGGENYAFDDIAKVSVRGEAIYDEENGEYFENNNMYPYYPKPRAVTAKGEDKLDSNKEESPQEISETVHSFWDFDADTTTDPSSTGNRTPHYDNNFYSPRPLLAVTKHGSTSEDKENHINQQFPSSSNSEQPSLKVKGPPKPCHRGTENEDEENVEMLFSKLRHNRVAYVKEALQAGTDINTVDNRGNSLLHICAQNDNKKMAALMIKLGCRINRENKKGLTALDYALMYKFTDLVEQLSEAGGVVGTQKYLLGGIVSR
jgi:hypothetical protein